MGLKFRTFGVLAATALAAGAAVALAGPAAASTPSGMCSTLSADGVAKVRPLLKQVEPLVSLFSDSQIADFARQHLSCTQAPASGAQLNAALCANLSVPAVQGVVDQLASAANQTSPKVTQVEVDQARGFLNCASPTNPVAPAGASSTSTDTPASPTSTNSTAPVGGSGSAGGAATGSTTGTTGAAATGGTATGTAGTGSTTSGDGAMSPGFTQTGTIPMGAPNTGAE